MTWARCNIYLASKPIRKTAYYGEIEYNLKSKQILKPKELKLNYVYGINEYSNLDGIKQYNN